MSFACLAVTGKAQAWPTYPGAIASHLGMECAPPCILCHTRPEGGRDYLQEGAFYFDLISLADGQSYRPLAGRSEDGAIVELVRFLEAGPCNVPTDVNYGTAPCDYDNDGMGDVAELRVLRDPNVPGKGLSFCVLYGCGASLAPPARPLDPSALGLLLAASGVIARRMRRAAPSVIGQREGEDLPASRR